MKTSIAINLDNAEFEESLQGLADILRNIASDIDFGDLPMSSKAIMDTNGNRVGTWKLTGGKND